MNLASTTLWSGFSTAIRMAAGIVVAKVVAIYGGPSGLALLGQFQNVVNLVNGLAGSLFQTAIVKYSAEHRDHPEMLQSFVGNAIKAAASVALFGTLLLVIVHKPLSHWVMHQEGYAPIFLLLSLAVSLLVANSIALGLLNGLGEIRTFLLLNAATSFVFLLLTLSLVWWLGVIGALYAVVLAPALMSLLTLFSLRPYWGLLRASIGLGIDREQMAKLGRFALIGLTSVLFLPLALLGMRTELIEQLGWQSAGHWQAVWQISTAYLAVITTGLSVYYLPRLSRLHTAAEIRNELRSFYRFIFPIVIALSLTVYFCRVWILHILYTEAFAPAADLMIWQLMGDVIKISSWGMAFLLVAKGMTKLFVISEIVFAASMYFGTKVLIAYQGELAPVMVYFFTYALYFVFVLISISHYLKRLEQSQNANAI